MLKFINNNKYGNFHSEARKMDSCFDYVTKLTKTSI